MDLVSIIIPLYNKSAYIEETLNSIRNQSWKHIEVIIIENNSTDDSFEVAKKHTCETVRLYRSNRKGASAARNLGLRIAKGNYIQFLDADDLLGPRKIESQINALSDNKLELAFSNWSRFKEQYDETLNINEEIPEREERTFKAQELLELQYMIPIHSWLCKRSLINRIGLWNENLTVNDDGEYFVRAVACCETISYTTEFAYYRSDISASLSRSDDRKSYESLYDSYTSYKKTVSQYSSPKLYHAANERFANLFLKSFNHHRDIAKLCEQQFNYNYRYCYPSLRESSKIFSSVLGIRSYLKLKRLVYCLPRVYR